MDLSVFLCITGMHNIKHTSARGEEGKELLKSTDA